MSVKVKFLKDVTIKIAGKKNCEIAYTAGDKMTAKSTFDSVDGRKTCLEFNEMSIIVPTESVEIIRKNL